MIYLIGFISRPTDTIYSDQVEDSISSRSLDGLQEKKKACLRVCHHKHLHGVVHLAQAVAETELLSGAQAFKFMIQYAPPLPAPTPIHTHTHTHALPILNLGGIRKVSRKRNT